MKKKLSFWLSLEEYLGKIPRRSPLSPQWASVLIISVVILASLINVKNSMVSATNIRSAIEKAVSAGDYALARELLNESAENGNDKKKVLGENTELEEMVYPELTVERKIRELEARLEEYPGNREIYLNLTSLYEQLGNDEIADEYREKARILDPNGVEF